MGTIGRKPQVSSATRRKRHLKSTFGKMATVKLAEQTDEAEEGTPRPAGPASPRTESLRSTVIRGMSWEILGQATMQGVRFAGNLVLTRLLAPEAFGVMGMVQVFMISLQLLADVGLHVSVMHDSRGDDDDFLDTVWTVSSLRGLTLFGISCLLAYPFAHFYQMPDLIWLLPITGISCIFRGLSSTSILTAGRHLRRKWYVMVECGSQVTGTVVTVLMTLAMRSVYALAWGWVVTAIVYLCLSFRDPARRPHRFHWDPKIVQSLTSYGRWLWLCGWLTILVQNSDRLALGAMVSASVLGNYVIGKNLAALPMIVFHRLLSGIAQPLFARIRHLEPEQIRRKVRKLRLGTLAALMPVFVLMAVLGQPLVNLLYEGEYSRAGWYCTLCAIGSMFIVATDMGDIFAAYGDGRTHFKLTLVRAAGLAIGLVSGYFLGNLWGHTDNGVLLGIVLAPLIHYPVQAMFYRKIHVWMPDVDALGLSVPLLMLLGLYLGWF